MKQTISIDEKHTEMVKMFCRIETVEIPKLMEEKKSLIKKKGELIYKNRLQNKPKRKIKRELNNNDQPEDTNNDQQIMDNINDKIIYNNKNELHSSIIIEKKETEPLFEKIVREKIFQLQDSIQTINEKIKQLKREKKNYYLNNSKYIFQYFEEMKNISSGKSLNTSLNNYSNENGDKIKSFFNIKKQDISNNTVEFIETKPSLIDDRHKNSRNLYHKYWKNVKNEIFNIQDYVLSADVCYSCREGEMIPQDEEGILICNNNKCGKFIPYIVDSCKPSNKEPPVEVSYTAYIRLNHFKEILSQFQAKETTQIPEEVIDAIRKRIKKERIYDMKEITYDKMREILRKLGLNKYFEHIQYINSIFGIKPPIMTEELHETLCVLFIEIQKPWAQFCPANRTNFFNYTYTLYQLCVLLGQTQYLPYIPLLKDRVKQIESDLIWKQICNYLNWAFYPTV